MEIETKKEKVAAVVSVKGRIDAVTAPEFEKKVIDLISKGEKTFVVNLVELDYISSAGLRSMLAIAKKLKEREGKIVFAGLRGPVEQVFKIAGFPSIFNVFDSEESALKQIQSHENPA
jgi:anti-anti-sigma factor